MDKYYDPGCLSQRIFAQFFAYSSWRQFLLDDHFKLSPPCTHLAELCGVAPSLLENNTASQSL